MDLQAIAQEYSRARDKVISCEGALDVCDGDELDRALLIVSLHQARLAQASCHLRLLQAALESDRAPF